MDKICGFFSKYFKLIWKELTSEIGRNCLKVDIFSPSWHNNFPFIPIFYNTSFWINWRCKRICTSEKLLSYPIPFPNPRTKQFRNKPRSISLIRDSPHFHTVAFPFILLNLSNFPLEIMNNTLTEWENGLHSNAAAAFFKN